MRLKDLSSVCLSLVVSFASFSNVNNTYANNGPYFQVREYAKEKIKILEEEDRRWKEVTKLVKDFYRRMYNERFR